MSCDLTFEKLRSANTERQREWPGNDRIDIAFRSIEVAGEIGEVMEAVKKYLRANRNVKGSTASVEDIADEMGDAIISIDLLASDLGIDLSKTVARKFNKTSVKYGMETRIEETQ